MKYLRILTSFFIILFFISPCNATQNEPDGFRGIKWDDPASKYTSIFNNYVKKGIKDNNYIKINEKLTLGEGIIKNVVYTFDNNGFYMASVLIEGESNVAAVRCACIKQWGLSKPGKRNDTLGTWLWDNAIAILMLLPPYGQQNQQVALTIVSKRGTHRLKTINGHDNSDF